MEKSGPIAKIIRMVLRKMGWDFACPRRGKVFEQTGDTFTVILDDQRVLEPLKKVPLATALPGVTVRLQVGCRVIVQWIDRDPTQPVMFIESGQAIEVSVNASAVMNLGADAAGVNIGQRSADIRLGPGSLIPAPGTYRPIVAVGDTTVNVINGAPAAITGVAPSVVTNNVVKV